MIKLIQGRHRDLEIDTTVKIQSSAGDQSRKQCCNHACQLHYPPIWTSLPASALVIPPLAGFSSVTGWCPLSPPSRPSVSTRRPSLPTRGPPSTALEEQGPNVKRKREDSHLTWMDGPRVRHWQGAISSGLGHRSSAEASITRRRNRATRALIIVGTLITALTFARLLLSSAIVLHSTCNAQSSLRGIIRSRMVAANSFTRHRGNSSRQL